MNLNTPITTEECSNKITITITDFVVSAGTINIFKNRLDKFWSDQDILYDYKADLHGIGNRSVVY